VGDLDIFLHDALKLVQDKSPHILAETINVEEEYSCRRSLRRGATSHAQNMNISKDIIEANNRWRKHVRSNGMTPGMSMMECYSDAKASIPILIKFLARM